MARSGKRIGSPTKLELFSIDRDTGELRTVAPMRPFADGYFDVVVIANNTEDSVRFGNVSVRVSPPAYANFTQRS